MKESIGVLLFNLGGPGSLEAVKPFLYNLFSDREIIKLGPSFIQKPVAWLISTLCSLKTCKMYSLIGGKSPIFDITTSQAEALEKALNQNTEHRAQNTDNPPSPPLSKGGMGGFVSEPRTPSPELSFKVYIGMRYSPPFIKDTAEKILRDGIRYLIVLPLYPHYSRATTGSAIAEFKRAIAKFCPPTHPSPSRGKGEGGGDIKIKYIEHWYDFPSYIEALAELIAKGIETFIDSRDGCPTTTTNNSSTSVGQASRLSERTFDFDIIYSAHSLPESFVKKGDPYLDHIKTTITAVNSLLITHYSLLVKSHLSFQSRSGPVKWLKPKTDETIIRLAKKGLKNLFIVPISFVSDNIETLYEIDILYKGLAEKHGINFKRCECLNTSEKFIEVLRELIIQKVASSQ